MSCKPKPRNALLIRRHRMTAWPPQSIVELLLHLSQLCPSTLAFGICGAARKKHQTVLWRWKSRPAQVFQIKPPTSSSTKCMVPTAVLDQTLSVDLVSFIEDASPAQMLDCQVCLGSCKRKQNSNIKIQTNSVML